MRLVLVSLAVICAIATTVSTDSTTNPAGLDSAPYSTARRRVQRKDHDTESVMRDNSTTESSMNGSDTEDVFKPKGHGDKVMPIPTTTSGVIIEEEESPWWSVSTVLVCLLIVIGGVGVGMAVILLCCCWIEKRRLRRFATEMSDRPQDVSVHPVSRPLILENNQCTSEEIPFDPPSPGIRPVVERVLPDPFSPVKYISTPNNVDSAAQMTPYATATPIERKQLPIVTPAKEKVPELHVDDYK